MKSRMFLMMVAVAAMEVGCTHYSYPKNNSQPAASVNQDLVSTRTAPMTGQADVSISDLKCSGSDYAMTVHYAHGFEDVQSIDVQFQVVSDSDNATVRFTSPTGMITADPLQQSADVALTIPASLVQKKNSDILVRIRLKTPKIVEFTSSFDQVHISDLCR